MEVAIIDWKNLDSRFVRDDVYEHINAPQWFDFLAPDVAIDDDSWFCRPVCNHPKTVEDFYRQTPPNSKKSSGGLSKRLPFAELTIKRDSTLKKRGLASYAPIFPNDSKSDTFTLDSENQNPNFSTPLNHKSRVHKATFKSSAEKKEQTNEQSRSLKKEQSRSLKSTLSARNLFSGGGGDILSKVTEFCNELKKLTLRKKEKEEEHTEAVICVGDSSNDESQKFDVKEPLLHEANSENCKPLPEINNTLEKSRRKIRYEDENTPVKIDVKIFKMSEEENLLPIRTCPPTPQCISATRVPSKASPLKEIIPLTPERDTGYRKPNWKNEQGGCQINQGRQAASTVTDKEAKGIDVFWFLKPCKIST